VNDNSANHRSPEEQDPVDIADEMLSKPSNRTVSPRGDALEGSPGAPPIEVLDGQMGPDEISEPEEVIKNNEAKLHP